MSEGSRHDVGVMIKSISTLDWQNEPIRNLQPRRVSLSKILNRHFLSQQSSFEDERILSGIDFRSGIRKNAKTPNTPSPSLKSIKSDIPHEMDHEPLWLSLLGGAGLFLGIAMIWILA